MEEQLKNAAEQAKTKAQEFAAEAKETFDELKGEITEKMTSILRDTISRRGNEPSEQIT